MVPAPGVRSLIAIAAMTVVLGLIGPARATTNAWETHGPPAPSVHAVLVDPLDPSTVYAGICGPACYQAGGVWRSTDGGNRWRLSSRGIPDGTGVYSLAVDPSHPSTIYAGTAGAGVFRSENAGSTWTPVGQGLPTDDQIAAIAVAPSDSNVLYAGTCDLICVSHFGGAADGVYRSTDRGATWERAGTGIPVHAKIQSVSVDPTDARTVLAGKSEGEIYRTAEGGDTWTEVRPRDESGTRALARDPSNPQTVYAGLEGAGVSKSLDGGLTWTEMNSGLTLRGVLTLAIDPMQPQTLFAGTGESLSGKAVIYRTDDGAAHWSASAAGVSTDVQALAIDLSDDERLYGGSCGSDCAGPGIVASNDGGATWVARDEGMAGADLDPIVVDSAIPTTVYAGSAGSGVYRSDDGGNHWSSINEGLGDSFITVRGLAIDPADGSVVYAMMGCCAGATGFYQSTDGGSSWSPLAGLPPDDSTEALATGPGGTVFVAFDNLGHDDIYRSADEGAHWTQLRPRTPSNSSVQSIAVSSADFQRVYASFCNIAPVVKISDDGGTTWRSAGKSLGQCVDLVADPQDADAAIATDGSELWRTRDAGAHWRKVGDGLPAFSITAVAFDPSDHATLYATLRGDGVFASDDNGDTWLPLNEGLSDLWAADVAVGGGGSPIYAATEGGVFTRNP
jgi:photosystem II stability/assembly factor-like uncharacterized protein